VVFFKNIERGNAEAKETYYRGKNSRMRPTIDTEAKENVVILRIN
jgi:hypothetical protein